MAARETKSFLWMPSNVLGRGITGAVFLGFDKQNGEAVAVKTFNETSFYRPLEVQMREFEVLRKLNHENIVKLLAIEDDKEGRGKVIVMEYCTGGSLADMLMEPENAYGLSQSEFLLVLKHLTAGMKHLRDNNLVHRDLKPGNIMKYTSEEGQTIYKLTDFGAARELSENQEFTSLYGTEEYLHPDMYKRALLKGETKDSFTAKVDLWSIGVTLYHIATGNLPFRSYGGRRNRATMLEIVSNKPPGAISGVQRVEAGPIVWSESLPVHCQFSAGLKLLVTPLLAGLLQEEMWSFEKYFCEVENIFNKKVLHVFYMNRASSVEIFMDPDERLFHFKEHVNLQTDVNSDSQLLLYDEELLEERAGTETSVRGYPPTSILKPIMLYSIENNNVSLPKELDLPKFPSFPAGVSVEIDASLARVACAVGHECKRRIESFTKIDTLVQGGINEFIALLKVTLNKLSEKSKHLDEVSGVVHELADDLKIFSICHEIHFDERKEIVRELKSLQAVFSRALEPIRLLHGRICTEDQLTQSWRKMSENIKNPSSNHSNEKAKQLVQKMHTSWQLLNNYRPIAVMGALTPDAEQIGKLQKIKIGDTATRIKALLVDDVKAAIEKKAECLSDWYKMAETIYLKARILEKELVRHDESFLMIKERLVGMKQQLKITLIKNKAEKALQERQKRDKKSEGTKPERSEEAPKRYSKNHDGIVPPELLKQHLELCEIIRKNSEMIEMLERTKI